MESNELFEEFRILKKKYEQLKEENQDLKIIVAKHKDVLETRDEHRRRLMDTYKEHCIKCKTEIQSLKDQNDHFHTTIQAQNEEINRHLHQINDLRNEIEMIKNRPCNDPKCKQENWNLKKSLQEAKEECLRIRIQETNNTLQKCNNANIQHPSLVTEPKFLIKKTPMKRARLSAPPHSYTDLEISKIRNNNNDNKPSPSGKRSKKLYFANDDDLVDLEEDDL